MNKKEDTERKYNINKEPTDTQKMDINFTALSENAIAKVTELLRGEQNQRTKDILREEYRYALYGHIVNWDENVNESIYSMAEKYGVTTDHIWDRYKQFFNFTAAYYKFIDRPPLLMPMWNSFLDYESGGSNDWDNDKMFKEPLYDYEALNRLNYRVCGQSLPIVEEDIPY